MSQQFKFGDRVRDEQGNEFVVIREEGAYCEVINERGKKSDFKGHQLTLAHTDDTARIDWLADPANKIGNVILPGWCSDEYNSLRDAIDAAMQEQAAEAEAT